MMDRLFTLSRRDFPSIGLDIRYTSLDLQDSNLTFISTNYLCEDFINVLFILIGLSLVDSLYIFIFEV